MSQTLNQIVEVEVKRWHDVDDTRVFGWHRVSIEAALKMQDEKFRCPECFGRVRLHRGTEDPETVTRGEHFKKHPGCSLGDCFDGKPRPHPAPLG
jgi:hypothetical protein